MRWFVVILTVCLIGAGCATNDVATDRSELAAERLRLMPKNR